MRKLLVAFAVSAVLASVSCGGGGSNSDHPVVPPVTPPPASTANYVVLVWSELGMHCMDGKDYSVFAVLPPYNTIRAQVVQRGTTPTAIKSGITVTYEAVTDANGSINTGSATKTNFWTFVRALFLTSPAPDIGLTQLATQSTTPHQMTFNSSENAWEAVGIPTVPYDDAGQRNAYPMAKIVARDSNGNLLASSTVVLAVSDELTCNTCHASNSDPAAKPAAGWENNSDPAKDMKLNILKLHDDRVPASAITPLLAGLSTAGYSYQSSLYQTAKGGTPILCASCHGTNALSMAGAPGVPALTASMHSKHASVVLQSTGTTLDNATSPNNSCYLCHPGLQTKCQRGAMNRTACYDCHGNLTKVGAATRAGWLDLPACQMCHNSGTRYTTTFDSSTGLWRTTSDTRFATNPNVPAPGKNLYRYSSGHGNVYCAGCHGSPHAEYPTLQPNDNVYSTSLQGHTGKIAECTVCHTTMPSTQTGGPHGLHTTGQNWVSDHRSAARAGTQACAYCHGTDFRGTPLSATSQQITLSVEDGTKTFTTGQKIGCYDCHNGPNGG